MVQITTRLVDPNGGGDYTDLASAIADMSAIAVTEFGTSDLRGFAGGAIIELHLSGDVHSLSTQINWNSNVMFCDENSFIILKAAPGAECEGEFRRAGSAVIEWTGTASNCLYIVEQFLRIEDLSFDMQGNNGAVTVDRNGSRVTRCMFQRTGTSTGGSVLTDVGTPNATYIPITIEDSTFVLNSNQFTRLFRFANSDVNIRNCTFWNEASSTQLTFFKSDTRDCTVLWENNVLQHRGKGTAFRQQQNGFTVTFTGSGNIETTNGNALPTSTVQGGAYWTISTDQADLSTGSQMIWEESSLKMYNVAGNDAWQTLTSLVDVNTTDISGDTRSVSGFNPGAFEADAAAAGVNQGSGGGTVGDATVAGTGSTIITATGGLTVAAATIEAGSAGPSGTLAGSTPSAEVAAGGRMVVSGTGAPAVALPTLSANTDALISGTASVTVGSAAVSGAAEMFYAGASALTTSGAQVAATGNQVIGATGALVTSATLTATAIQPTSSAATLAVSEVTLTAIGGSTISATASPVTSSVTIAATGTALQTTLGTASLAVGSPSVTATGGPVFGATGALAIQPTASGSGEVISVATVQGEVTWSGEATGATYFQAAMSAETAPAQISGGGQVLPLSLAYITATAPTVVVAGSARQTSGGEWVILRTAEAQISGQGVMSDVPEHSKGAGIIVT